MYFCYCILFLVYALLDLFTSAENFVQSLEIKEPEDEAVRSPLSLSTPPPGHPSQLTSGVHIPASSEVEIQVLQTGTSGVADASPLTLSAPKRGRGKGKRQTKVSAKREKQSRLEEQKVVSDGEFELPQSAVQIGEAAVTTTVVPSVASSVETSTQIEDSEAAENLAFLATYVSTAQDQPARDEATFAAVGSDFESGLTSENGGTEFLDKPLGNGASGTPENMSSEIVAVAEVMSSVHDHEISVEITPAVEWGEEERGTELTVVTGGKRRRRHGRSVRRAEKMATIPVNEEEEGEGGGGGGGGGLELNVVGGESYLGERGADEELGHVRRSRRKGTQVRGVAVKVTKMAFTQKSMSESLKRSNAVRRSPKTQRERAQRREEGGEREGANSPPTKRRRSQRVQRSPQLEKPEGGGGGGDGGDDGDGGGGGVGNEGGGGSGGSGGGVGGGGIDGDEEEEMWREGGHPSLWGVEEVAQFVASIPQCTFCTEVFRDHVSVDT